MEAKYAKWRGKTEKADGIEYFEQRMAEEWGANSGGLMGYSWHPYEEADLPRHHPLLIECVEALGGEHREGASGPCAALKIVEIPDGVDYEIEEYDGSEWIAEKHRKWS